MTRLDYQGVRRRDARKRQLRVVRPPSGKQLDYLRVLGWNGPLPLSASHASALIDELKSAKSAHGP